MDMDTDPQQTFVVAYDFSEHADAALVAAVDLARRFPPVDLMVVHVIHEPVLAYPSAQFGGLAAPMMTPPVVQQAAREALDKVVEPIHLEAGRVSAHVVEGLSIDQALVEFCEENGAELLVTGTHGRTGVAHVFLGSVAERAIRRAPCPVLTLRANEDEDEGEEGGLAS